LPWSNSSTGSRVAIEGDTVDTGVGGHFKLADPAANALLKLGSGGCLAQRIGVVGDAVLIGNGGTGGNAGLAASNGGTRGLLLGKNGMNGST
jgi:hypothetical protein